ncbi:MAG: HAMP domain-containing histidine kinase [Bacteroidaceae bacterium]|nr:HAMP domain-containing histidine kinase [Bacteroidaceae bacterium]
MKKTTIWILGIVMGLSFLSLLYLQISYIEEMATMRNEQFDESVKRALLAASKDVEQEEVDRWLREDISNQDRAAWNQSSQGSKTQSQTYTITSPDGSKIELKTFSSSSQELPKAMISRRHGTKTIPQTSRSMADMLRNRYLYQRDLLDEIAWQMVYNADVKPVSERVNFRSLDQYIHSGLVDNGVNLSYHFKVIDGEGKEVYRCTDYNEKGNDQVYTQPLFLNDTPAKMSLVQVHFPGKRDYIFDSVSFMIPSVVFTLVLLVTFIFTIYVIFRQKKLTEMKNDFINNMTHEFKTPISTISLAAQMLNDPAVSKSPTMFQHISGVINDETKRLRLEVEKVLQMSMFDHEKGTLKLKEIDMNALIEGVVNTFALKVERYNGKIDSELLAEDPIVFADEMHITNVIFNLMDNAVKYKRADVDLHLIVKTWNEGKKLMIAVQDNGIGIKKENLKKIFERFYRVHTGNLHDVKGFGLGLAYVKKIITDHQGTIKAESELNVGTRFIIALPLFNHD